MPTYRINSFRGGLSDEEDKGIKGAFKFASNLDIRKKVDSLSAGQALIDEGLLDYSRSPSLSQSPSASVSPSLSASVTPSPSSSTSPSSSVSSSQSASTGISPSPSLTPSTSVSLSASPTPSSSISLSPSQSGALTSVFADLIRWWVKCSDGFTYGFGSTGHIYRRDSDGVHVRVYKDANGSIKGAAEWYTDDGKTWLYWATDKHVMRKEIPGNSNWNDVQTVAGNLTSADWHTMGEAGGALMIANKSVLAMVGYDGSFTPEAVQFIPGNITKTIVERNGRVISGTYRAANPDGGINAAIDAEYPLAQIGEDGQLVFANMTDSMPVKRFPGGGKVNPGGVCNEIEQVNFFEWEQTALSWLDKHAVGNMALFAVYEADSGKGGVYSYGRRYKNHPFVLNLEYLLDADELGAVVHVDGKTIVSYRDGSDFGVKATDLTAKAEAVYEGLDLELPPKRPINNGTWKEVELFMKPLPANSWVEFWYKVDKADDFTRAKISGDGAARYDEADGKEAVFRVQAEGNIFEPRVVVHPYGNETPEVYEVLIHFT